MLAIRPYVSLGVPVADITNQFPDLQAIPRTATVTTKGDIRDGSRARTAS